MNNVTLIGRLTKDPEIYETDNSVIASYTLAVDRPFKNRDGEREADFIRCKAFGYAAEFAETYLEKGSMIGIRGAIRTGSYKNKDGDTVYTTEVNVENHYFCGSAKKAEKETEKEEDSDTKKTGRRSRRGRK